jgi:MFS family permease
LFQITDRYTWSQVLQSVILGTYYLGYSTTHISGGMLVEKFGVRIVVLWASLFSSFCTALIPLCAQGHHTLVILNRFIVGLCGVIYQYVFIHTDVINMPL